MFIFFISSKSAKTISHSKRYYTDILKAPKHIMAPMVDQSELAFRLLTRNNGCDLCYTQMHHAFNFNRDGKYRDDSIDWQPHHYIPQRSDTGVDGK